MDSKPDSRGLGTNYVSGTLHVAAARGGGNKLHPGPLSLPPGVCQLVSPVKPRGINAAVDRHVPRGGDEPEAIPRGGQRQLSPVSGRVALVGAAPPRRTDGHGGAPIGLRREERKRRRQTVGLVFEGEDRQGWSFGSAEGSGVNVLCSSASARSGEDSGQRSLQSADGSSSVVLLSGSGQQ